MQELETFKLVTRNEYNALIEFNLEQFKKAINERFTKNETRITELGKECAEIIPPRLFKVSKNKEKFDLSFRSI